MQATTLLDRPIMPRSQHTNSTELDSPEEVDLITPRKRTELHCPVARDSGTRVCVCVCEQLAQGCYLKAERSRVELAISYHFYLLR